MNAFRVTFSRILLGILSSLLPAVAGAVIIGEYPVAPLTTSTSSAGVAAGPDGNIWFTAVVPNRIGRITPSGAVTSYSISGFGMLTGGITVGPDENIWFTKEFNGAVMRMTPSGTVTEFPVSMDSPKDITVGPDGNLWFAGGYNAGRITPAGVVTEFAVPEIFIASITAGPDGNLWFTGRRYPAAQALIGKMTPAGTVTTYPLGPDGVPTSIAAGPDGNLWFTFDNNIGRITTGGTFTLFPYPVAGGPTSITTGPDGNLWFTDYGNSTIGRITPAGSFLAFINTPSAVSAPQRITTSPDGLMWFYESNTNKIGLISIANVSGFLPLTSGAVWSYSVNNGASSFTRSVVSGTTNINGANTTLLSDSDGFGIYVTNDGNGIREHRQVDFSDLITYSPPITHVTDTGILGLPTFSSGIASGTISGLGDFFLSYSNATVVQALENVTVGAGTFRAARLQSSLTFTGDGGSETATETNWFANGVGLVKGVADADTLALTSTNLAVTTPDIFSYVVPTAAPPVTRNTFTVTGTTASAPIGITGGEYSVNGGPYTTASGSVTNGQSVTVRPLSPLNAFVRQAVVTIGGVTGVFNAIVPPAPSANLSTTVLGFGDQLVATTSSAQTVTLTNNGNATLTISSISVSGDFSRTTTCGATLAPDASCEISASFTPTAPGARSGQLSISSDAAGSPHTVTLTGTGVVPDTQTPTVPGELTATAVSGSQINLIWNPASDNVGIAAYQVFRDGVFLATVNAPALVFSDTGLAATTPYSYTVAACDAAGNCSAQSGSASATTLAAGQYAYEPNLELGFNLISNALTTVLDVTATFGNQDAPAGANGEITANVVSIWKWEAMQGRWAFNSPQMTVAGNAAYAADHNYNVLSVINPGEGYWVNAILPMTLPVQSGTGFNWNGLNFPALPPGFNLITTADAFTPSQFNLQVSSTPPSPGVIPTDNFTTLWAWDALAGTWYFYSPLLEAAGGLPAVKAHTDSHNYLHFQDYGKLLGLGTGFWVNRP